MARIAAGRAVLYRPQSIVRADMIALRDAGLVDLVTDVAGNLFMVAPGSVEEEDLLEVRLWDESASDTFYVAPGADVYNQRGERIGRGAGWHAALAAASALDNDSTEAKAEAAAIREWADGYDGDTREICCQVRQIRGIVVPGRAVGGSNRGVLVTP